MKSKFSLERVRLSSIRTQIILGFGLILGLTLIIVAINLLSLRRLEAEIRATVDEASRVRELSQEFQNQFLLARQQEKAFLDNWRSLGYEAAADAYVSSNQLHTAQARESLTELQELVESSDSDQFENVVEEVALLGPALDGYESAFLETADRIGERSRAGGFELRLQEAKQELEDLASTIPNSIELNRVIVQMDASEQAFFSSSKQEHVDRDRLLALSAKDLLNSTPHLDWAYSTLARPLLLDKVDERMAAFGELVQLEQEIDINAAIFQETTTDINELTGHIGDEAEVALALSRANLRRAIVNNTVLTVVTGLLVFGVGVLTAWLLARRIIGPLGELTEAAQQISQGSLNAQVNVRGSDEFAALGHVFNQMVSQLRNLIGSLEQRVAERTRALSTSFQVSRRLSTILDQRQLVEEVVEQVRSAFDYYHVHIYLFDEWKEKLVMVGGTGEAGRAMLAAGHKLDRGQGLVGKAADTRRAIIVPDVSKDPSWLPNPLLPSTRSEIAVPIMLGEQVKGVLDVQHDVRDGLGQNDAELLQTVANQVAIALQNAQLYEDAQNAAEREATVNLISQRIQQAGTVESVLQVAAAELGKALSAQRTSVQIGMAAWPAKKPSPGKQIKATQPGDGHPKNGQKNNGRPPVMNE
jgi:GAF domain-containing protein